MKLFLSLILSLAFLGCSNSSSDSSGKIQQKVQPVYVNWEAVPDQFNPEIETSSFNTIGAEKIKINLFGFQKDVRLQYSSDLAANEVQLHVYKVWDNSAQWGYFSSSTKDKDLQINNYGSYQCSIKVVNQLITELDGGCYVRLVVIMPLGSKIEVYNAGELISDRFIPMDNFSFLEKLDDATWADDKFLVIEEYLQSYKSLSLKSELNCEQLSQIISEFSWKDEKLKALQKLHAYVTDRDQLAKMIEKSFGYFDQEEAKKIVGI